MIYRLHTAPLRSPVSDQVYQILFHIFHYFIINLSTKVHSREVPLSSPFKQYNLILTLAKGEGVHGTDASVGVLLRFVDQVARGSTLLLNFTFLFLISMPKAQIPLVALRHDTTRHAHAFWHRKKSCCVPLVGQHGATGTTRTTRHVTTRRACRVVSWRSKWNLG